MDELEKRMKSLLIEKINNGEETRLTIEDIKGLNIRISLDEKLLISSNITNNVSEQTLKMLFSLYSQTQEN